MKYYYIGIAIIIISVVALLCYNKCDNNYSGQVEVELIGVFENPSDSLKRELLERDSIRITYFIDNMEMLNFTIEDLSLQKKKEKIKNLINLKLYDYYISVGKRIIKCNYSKDFTDHHDLICECEDNRIPLDIKFSRQVTDSIYMYKLLTSKNMFREAGP